MSKRFLRSEFFIYCSSMVGVRNCRIAGLQVVHYKKKLVEEWDL